MNTDLWYEINWDYIPENIAYLLSWLVCGGGLNALADPRDERGGGNLFILYFVVVADKEGNRNFQWLLWWGCYTSITFPISCITGEPPRQRHGNGCEITTTTLRLQGVWERVGVDRGGMEGGRNGRPSTGEEKHVCVAEEINVTGGRIMTWLRARMRKYAPM